MNPLIQAQITAATASVKPYNWEFEDPEAKTQTTSYGRDLKIVETADGDFASAEIKNSRPTEGPKIEEVKQSRSPVLPSPSPQPWGKPNRR